MDTKQTDEAVAVDDRLQNVLNNLSRYKIDFINRNEECSHLREIKFKLETELREVRELEKGHRQHLDYSRQMINNLQETISQLVYIKRDVKTLKDKISSKEASIVEMQKITESALQKQNEKFNKIRVDYDKQIEEIKAKNATEIEQKQQECDTQVALVTCDVEELKVRMKDMELETREKINIIVLESEEKLQREIEQKTQLQEQLLRETARSDLTISTYRRRLEDLEKTLKHNQFKEYLQNVYTSPYGSQFQSPHSVNRGPPSLNPVQEKAKMPYPSQSRPFKSANSLQIIYEDKSEKGKLNGKKDSCRQPKKRKLFNANEFLE